MGHQIALLRRQTDKERRSPLSWAHGREGTPPDCLPRVAAGPDTCERGPAAAGLRNLCERPGRCHGKNDRRQSPEHRQGTQTQRRSSNPLAQECGPRGSDAVHTGLVCASLGSRRAMVGAPRRCPRFWWGADELAGVARAPDREPHTTGTTTHEDLQGVSKNIHDKESQADLLQRCLRPPGPCECQQRFDAAAGRGTCASRSGNPLRQRAELLKAIQILRSMVSPNLEM